ncbi:MAG: FAD-dependent oxidoreductase [Candidatus Liptonbacteria bacterium]|nr:FAD-dependent oxidoreductase [Candidatus Liptonbacteria bacterium]
MYDLIIIGGGPAGVAAGVYAGRKKMKTLLVAEAIGGQSVVSAGIQNWIGDIEISGFDLAQRLEAHLRSQPEVEVVTGERVASVSKTPTGYEVKTGSGQTYSARFLLITSGSRRRKLNVPGEAEFESKGVFYCSICDAPVMAGKSAAVVGGGNAGLEAVLDLLPYATEIYLLERGEALKGDAVTQEKIKADPKVHIITQAEVQRILGEQFVSGLECLDRKSNQVQTLPASGVFVEIGAVPNAEFLGDLVKTNELHEIVVDHQTQATSDPGIWAAGDVTDVLYKQNNISAGDAIKAVLNIYQQI